MKLRVGVVGAGLVGPVLGAALGSAGHEITGVATTSEAGRERVDVLLHGVPVLTVPEVVECSELVLIAVPESELTDLVAGLAAVGAWRAGQLVAHTAPGYGTGVLEPARRAGAIALALHPVMVFTGTSIDLDRLRESWCGITAPAPVLPIAEALATEMGAEPVVVPELSRPAYTRALGELRALSHETVTGMVQRLADAGVAEAHRVIAPLVRSAVESALRGGSALVAGD